MPATNREQIYQALFDKLKSISDFVVAERRLVKPENVNPEDMPALFMIQDKETTQAVKQVHGTPIKREFKVFVHIYLNAGDPVKNESTGVYENVFPSSLANPIVDKLDAIVKPDAPGNRVQTLGGLVHYVYVGEVNYFEHLTANQILIECPVEMLVTMI